MITYKNSEKNLVIPSSLGLGGMKGGTGGGITEEEAQELIDASIEVYDTEIQAELEGIRENVSGNTDNITANRQNIEALSGATGALSDNIQNLSAATSNIADSVNTVNDNLETLSGSTGNIASNLSALSASTSGIASDLATLSASTVDLSGATESGLSVANEAISALSAATESIKGNVGTNAENIEALSGITSGLSAGLTELSGITSANTEDIATLSAITATLKGDIAIFNYPDWTGTTQELYDAIATEYYDNGRSVALEGTLRNLSTVGILQMAKAESGSSVYNTYFTFSGTFPGTGVTDSNIYTYEVQLYSGGSTVGITNKIFNVVHTNRNYSLPAATSSSLGGVKIGSGVTMDSDSKLSVKIGEGLAFSGDTLVVSGRSESGPKVIFLNKLTEQERLALYNELASKYDYNTSSWTSAFTEDEYAFFIDLREYAEQQTYHTNDHYEGFFPMQIERMHPSDWGGAAIFGGVEADRVGNGHLICIRFVITFEGGYEGATWWNSPSSDPTLQYNLRINSDGTIANDQDWSYVSYNDFAGRLVMQYYENTQYGDIYSEGNVKWVNMYPTTYNGETKWYWIWAADICIGTTMYSGVWGMLQDQWYTGSDVPPQLLQWTSGATYESQTYPPII